MTDIASMAMAVRQDLLAEKLDVLATSMHTLIAELQRANSIHEQTLRGLQAVLNNRDEGDEWKQ